MYRRVAARFPAWEHFALAERLGYLVSQYPTLSHSFILREIVGLRRHGLEIDVASVLRPDRSPERLSTDEKEEFARAYYVRAAWKHWPWLHIRTLVQRPRCYLASLWFAVQLARGDVFRTARHFRFFGEAVVAGHWFRARKTAHVHTHFASLTALLLHRIFGTAISMTIHGSDEFIDPVGFCMAEKVRAASLVVGISRYGCSQIMRFSCPDDWEKVAMVRLGIDLEQFRPLADRPASDRSFQVICVGRLVPVKAYRLLIQAVWMLAARQYPVQLTIVGGGPDREPLQKFSESIGAASIVRFTGPLPNRQARDLVAAADCFALASFAEGVPVVLMEAMALEVPCVATRVTGVPELIEDGRDGLLVPPGDCGALSAAIERLLLEPELRKSLGRSGRRRVAAEYNLDQNLLELAGLLRKLL